MSSCGTRDAVNEMVRFVEEVSSSGPQPLDDDTSAYARLLIADSLVCGLAAAELDRTTMSLTVFAAAGGVGEAEAVGWPTLVPALQAAWINAEAMNLLDADDTFFNGSHFGSLTVASALASAQRAGSTWAQLLRAVVVGFELSARIMLSIEAPSAHVLVPGAMAPGATLAAALAASEPRCALDAVGLSMRSAPGPAARQHALAGTDTIKYSPYGTLAWQAQASSQLAGAGFRSRPWDYEGPDIFGLAGIDGMSHLPLSREIGTSWWLCETSLKPYPLYRLGNVAVDALAQLLSRHPVDSAAIDRISVELDPRALTLPFQATLPSRIPEGPTAPIVAAQNLRYCLALTALGVPPGPQWSERGTIGDPAVWDLADRITVSDQPAVPWGSPPLIADRATGRVRDSVARIVLHTSDAVLSHVATVADGDPWNPGTRPDWSWLQAKARDFGVSATVVERVRGARPEDRVADVFGR